VSEDAYCIRVRMSVYVMHIYIYIYIYICAFLCVCDREAAFVGGLKLDTSGLDCPIWTEFASQGTYNADLVRLMFAFASPSRDGVVPLDPHAAQETIRLKALEAQAENLRER
jgi:hypothetical protein